MQTEMSEKEAKKRKRRRPVVSNKPFLHSFNLSKRSKEAYEDVITPLSYPKFKQVVDVSLKRNSDACSVTDKENGHHDNLNEVVSRILPDADLPQLVKWNTYPYHWTMQKACHFKNILLAPRRNEDGLYLPLLYSSSIRGDAFYNRPTDLEFEHRTLQIEAVHTQLRRENSFRRKPKELLTFGAVEVSPEEYEKDNIIAEELCREEEKLVRQLDEGRRRVEKRIFGDLIDTKVLLSKAKRWLDSEEVVITSKAISKLTFLLVEWLIKFINDIIVLEEEERSRFRQKNLDPKISWNSIYKALLLNHFAPSYVISLKKENSIVNKKLKEANVSEQPKALPYLYREDFCISDAEDEKEMNLAYDSGRWAKIRYRRSFFENEKQRFAQLDLQSLNENSKAIGETDEDRLIRLLHLPEGTCWKDVKEGAEKYVKNKPPSSPPSPPTTTTEAPCIETPNEVKYGFDFLLDLSSSL